MSEQEGAAVPIDDDKITPPAEPDKAFTQADVDRIVQERLARAKSTPPPDYEDLKAKAARLAELEESQQTDLEKALERAKKAEEESARVKEAADRRLIEAAVIAEAAKQSALKPEHLPRLIDTSGVTVGDDGQVTGAGDAVQAFLKANPEYVGGRANGSADQGARGANGVKQLTRDELKSMSPDQILKARREGRTALIEGRL